MLKKVKASIQSERKFLEVVYVDSSKGKVHGAICLWNSVIGTTSMFVFAAGKK